MFDIWWSRTAISRFDCQESAAESGMKDRSSGGVRWADGIPRPVIRVKIFLISLRLRDKERKFRAACGGT